MVQKSNLNLTFHPTQYEFNFINILKRAQQPNLGFYTNNILHYPTETTGITFTIYYPEPGVYVCRWEGSGAIDPSEYAETNASSGIYTGGGASNNIVTNGRFTYTVPAAGYSYLARIRGTTISNAVVCRADEEALLDAGQLCRPRFLELIEEYNPSSLRFMDMQSTNNSLAGRDWSEMPSADRLTYTCTSRIPDKIVGRETATAAITGTNTYEAPAYTGMPVAYEHGEFFHGFFENANTLTSATLDSGGRGAKSLIVGYGAAYPGELFVASSNTRSIATDTGYTLYFDAYFDAWRFTPDGANQGYPIPVLVQMCNETGVPGWFCIPYFASDAWITSFANYLDANYEPATVRIEFMNEVWNGASGFWNKTRAARAGAVLMGLTGGDLKDSQGYTGLRTRQISEIMRPILGSKLKIGLMSSVQHADSDAQLAARVENALFQNTSTATSGTLGTPADNLSGANAPILFTDFIGYGLYYYNARLTYLDAGWDIRFANPPDGVTGIDDVLEAADNFALGTDAGKRAAFEFLYTNQLNANSSYGIVTDDPHWFSRYNDLAVEYDKPVCIYEANHEHSAPTTAWCTANSINTAYGGVTGKIEDMIQGWFNSSQYERSVALLLNAFYGYSKSESFSLFAMGATSPWLCFPKISESSTHGGDTTQEGFANWRAHCKRNNGIKTFRITTS